jgi:hypothetical protein
MQFLINRVIQEEGLCIKNMYNIVEKHLIATERRRGVFPVQ